MDKLPKSYIFGWVAAIVLAFGPLFFDQTRQYAPLFVPAILSIIIPIVIDQYNAFSHQEKLKMEILAESHRLRESVARECQLAITNAQAVTKFTLSAAHNYVCQNAIRAKRVFNTRLTDHSSEENNSQYMGARNLQDQGFAAAIRQGAEYHLVYDRTQEPGVSNFRAQIVDSPDKARAGIIQATPVDSRGMPLIQFIVLEYENEQECLVGYGLGKDVATAQDIYLIRSTPLCNYLRYVHDHYVRLYEPKQQQPKQPQPNLTQSA